MSSTVIPSHPGLGDDVTKTLPVPPNISIPPPKPIAHHGLLIHSMAGGKGVATIDGVQVRNLTWRNDLSTASSVDDPAPTGELVANGTIDLFGDKNLPAEFDVWHGPPPSGITLGSAAPSVQKAFIKGSLKLSQLIPSLGADISLENVSIFHQNYLFDSTKDLGYDLDADLVINSSLGSFSSVLSKVLAVNDPRVHIHASLGPNQSWGAAPNTNALTIKGSFSGHSYKATPGVEITSVGICMILSRNPDKVVTRDVEAFGTLNLTLPGGTIITLDYKLKEASGTVQLTADLPSGVTWVNPMGAQGFVLNPVKFTSSLPLSDPWNALALNLTATFQYQTTTIDFAGSYIAGGASSLNANIKDFNLASLQQLYEAVRNESLMTPKVDVTIGSAELTIASGRGFTAKLTNVNIAGYAAFSADLSISSTGCFIRADLETVRFGDVTVDSPYIELDLQSKSSAKSSDATIRGDVKFEDLEFSVAVHLYTSESGVVPKRTEWTVCAKLTSSDNSLALSKIAPKLKGTAFDLALKDVAFIAASKDNSEVGDFITGGYKPEKGVQVFATLDEIPVFTSLAKSNVTGMVLRSSWSKATGFEIEIRLPAARNLKLGKGITSEPIKVSLEIPMGNESIPCLKVTAGLKIPVVHSEVPLIFDMTLAATAVRASVKASLNGGWNNPFGISNKLTIGPVVTLEATIDYVTGIEGLLFGGGMAIGDTIVNALVSVDEDPELDLLYVEVDKLNFSDVVSFAEKLLHLDLPPPPKDFLVFEAIKVYICPVPLTVMGETHPAGFSFKGNMIVFGKQVSISCDTSSTSLSVKGSVQDFEIGPLKVKGADGADKASLEVQVSKGVQHLSLDGAVTLYAETVAVRLQVDTQPSPKASFQSEFKFTDLVTFKVDAQLVGPLNFKDLSKADFTFSADLEQHVLEHIHDELLEVFKRAQHADEKGIADAKRKIAADQDKAETEIANAKKQLDVAQANWNTHHDSVNNAGDKDITEYNKKLQDLKDSVAIAEKKYNDIKRKVDTTLGNANHDREIKMQAARNDLANIQRKAASDIKDAQNQVDSAQVKMNRDFGSVEKDVENAKRKVEDLKGKIDSINRDINHFKHGSFADKFKIPKCELERDGLEVAMKTAATALTIAEDVLKSTNYVASKSALGVAQKTLELAKLAEPKLVDDAKMVLDGVDKVTQAAINRATEAVVAVENGAEKAALDGKNATLDAFKRANDVLFETASKAKMELDKSVEYIAFQTATTVLSAAKVGTKSLNIAKDVLDVAESGSKDILKVGSAIVKAGTEALNITSVHLSGSLGKSVGGAGFTADIKGVVLKKNFSFTMVLHPSKVEDFFKDMVEELKKKVMKIL